MKARLRWTWMAAATSIALVALLGFSQATQAAPATCEGVRATISGTPGNDVIVGLDGDDEIRGRGGNDLICGDDVVRRDNGVYDLVGNGGADELRGDLGVDNIRSDGRAWRPGPGETWFSAAAGTTEFRTASRPSSAASPARDE